MMMYFMLSNMVLMLVERRSIQAGFVGLNVVIGCYMFKEGALSSWLGVNYVVDGVSGSLVVLTTMLVFVSVICVWEKRAYVRALIVLVGLLVIGVFTVSNLLWFYIYFESVLIPMYILILKEGTRERRVRASYYFQLYTLIGSVFFLLGILLVYRELGSLDYAYMMSVGLSEELERRVWLLLFIGFIVKVPMFPMHLWLGEAHVEAPTEGSVLLAGVLLKLGTYGYLRYNIDLMGMSTLYYMPLIELLGCLGMLYTSLSCLRQTDMKRVIAYGSIGHMSMTIVGLSCMLDEGYAGGIFQMVSHGIVSGGLFLCIGYLYSRVKTRDLYYISGLSEQMPVFSILFFLLILGNMGFPGTSGFVGEILLLDSIVLTSKFLGLVTGISMLLTGGYSLYLYNRMIFGNVSRNMLESEDLNIREIIVVLILVCVMLVIGVNPGLIMSK